MPSRLGLARGVLASSEGLNNTRTAIELSREDAMRIRSFVVRRRNQRGSPWWDRAALAVVVLMITAFAVVGVRSVRRHDGLRVGAALLNWPLATLPGPNGQHLAGTARTTYAAPPATSGSTGRLCLCSNACRAVGPDPVLLRLCRTGASELVELFCLRVSRKRNTDVDRSLVRLRDVRPHRARGHAHGVAGTPGGSDSGRHRSTVCTRTCSNPYAGRES